MRNRRIGLALMLLSALAIAFFGFFFFGFEILVPFDAVIVASVLLLVSIIAIKWPGNGGMIGVYISAYPLLGALTQILNGDFRYFILGALGIIYTLGSLIVLGTRHNK